MSTSGLHSEETLDDHIELVRQLARENFIELGIGTDLDFEKRWRDAFGEREATPTSKDLDNS